MATPTFRPGSPAVLAVFLFTLQAVPAAAQQTRSLDYDRLWSVAELHSGDAESFFQEVVLSGRFQVDQSYVDSGGTSYAGTDLRRFRFGVKAQFLEDFTVHAEADLHPEGGNLGYRRLTDAYFAWSPNDAFELTVGKQGAAFTMDGQTSSKRLLTVDRSNLTNNIWFTEEYVPGISMSGKADKLLYHVGLYSSGEKNRGFGNSSGGEFVLATVGRDFADGLTAREALLRLNYVYNEPDARNGFTRPLERIGSLNFSFDAGGWGVRADVSGAKGYLGQSDLWGVMVMPHYTVNEGMQLVLRYTFVESDDENGVRFGRYEREIAEGRGDRYREIYAGLNYFWYGHKLKLQTGLQYADMDDRAADGGAFTGWSFTTGLRLSW